MAASVASAMANLSTRRRHNDQTEDFIAPGNADYEEEEHVKEIERQGSQGMVPMDTAEGTMAAGSLQNKDATVKAMFKTLANSTTFKLDKVMEQFGTLGSSSLEVEEHIASRSAFVLPGSELMDEHITLFIPNTGTIDPRSYVYKGWEVVMALSLLYTATVTPFDVAVLGGTATDDPIFWCNRLLDVLFLLDLLINWRLAFFSSSSRQLLIIDRATIRKRYMSSWFWIDLISIMPLELINSDLQILKLLRLLRLLKLAKLARVDGMIARWQITLGLHYSTVNLVLNLMAVILAVHWIGCLWFLVMKFEDSDNKTWISTLNPHWTVDNVPIADGYCAALYHAAMTLTTIGYGDVVPANMDEQWVSVLLLQLFGAWMYAYVIAVSTAIISSMNRELFEFNASVDSLTDLSEEENLPRELVVRVKDYLSHARPGHIAKDQMGLIQRVSNSLQAECAESLVNYINQCGYFRDLGKSFKTQLALKLIPESYPPGELILQGGAIDSMVFVVSGIVNMYGDLCIAPRMIGEEAICDKGVQRIPARAITDVRILRLARSDIRVVMERFPHATKVLRKEQIRLAFKRGILTALENSRVLERKERQQARTRKRIRTKTQNAMRATIAFKEKITREGGDISLLARTHRKCGALIGRPDEVDEWEEGLDYDELCNTLEQQQQLLDLDREIQDLMKSVTTIQNQIAASYTQVNTQDETLVPRIEKISAAVGKEQNASLFQLQEQYWEARQLLDVY